MIAESVVTYGGPTPSYVELSSRRAVLYLSITEIRKAPLLIRISTHEYEKIQLIRISTHECEKILGK
jgi:hypothetical protein